MTVLRRSDNPILRICLEVSLILEAKDVLKFTNMLAILCGPFPDNSDVGSRDEAIHVDRNVILGSSIWCVRRREKEHRVEAQRGKCVHKISRRRPGNIIPIAIDDQFYKHRLLGWFML